MYFRSLRILSQLTTGKQSVKYLEKYIQLNDSLFQRERTLKNQFAKVRYETDKKEKENTVLKSENKQKQAEIESERLQKTVGLVAAGGSISILFLSILFFKNRHKKLVYFAQLQKAEAREHERQQIAKSLHDEVAGDLRLLHQKLENSQQFEVAKRLDTIKENVRNLSHRLSSVSFDKVSFKDQIINLVSDYFTPNFKISVNGLQDFDWTLANNSIKRLLYLTILR